MITNSNYLDAMDSVARKPYPKGAMKKLASLQKKNSRLFPSAYPRRGWSGGEFENESKPLRPRGGKTVKRG
jgi:hypothetical protein